MSAKHQSRLSQISKVLNHLDLQKLLIINNCVVWLLGSLSSGVFLMSAKSKDGEHLVGFAHVALCRLDRKPFHQDACAQLASPL